MKRRKKAQMQMMLLMFAMLLLIVVLVVVGIFALKGCTTSKKIKSITLTPDFAEQELEVDRDYVFSIETDPKGAKLKDKIDFIIDSANAEFEIQSDSENKAVLHTLGAGAITICIRSKDDKSVESNYLYYTIRDLAAEAEAEAAAAATAAEAEAAKQAEAEAVAAAAAEAAEAKNKPTYVKTNDTVRIRKTPETDTNDNIIKTCNVGDMFLRLGVEGDWSRIQYDDGEAYIKTEFLNVVSEEEAGDAAAAAAEAEAKIAEAKTQQKEQEALQAAAQKNAATGVDPNTAAPAAETPAGETPAAETTAPAAPAGTVAVTCADGVAYFTPTQVQYFHGLWDYTGKYEEMVAHHPAAELRTLCQNAGIQ